MPEVKKPVKSIQVDYTCDVCLKGNMESTGQAITTNAPHYWHKCDSCGTEQTFRRVYPTIEWETIQ